MKLSADLEVDGTTRQTRAAGGQTLARSALTSSSILKFESYQAA